MSARGRSNEEESPTTRAFVSGFLPVVMTGWVTWQVLEAEHETLLRSQFAVWGAFLAGAVIAALIATFATWRAARPRWGALGGVLAALVAVVVGLIVDLSSSGSLTG